MRSTNRTKCLCPSCGAEQVWQDECRRCRANLSELRLLNEKICSLEQKLIHTLNTGDYRHAVRYAQQLKQIDPIGLNNVLQHLTLSHDFQ
jgi:hypothetical protein